MRALIIIFVIILSSLSFAQNDDFTLSGEVLTNCYVSISETPASVNLDIENGEVNTLVANVTLVSNSTTFYLICLCMTQMMVN